MKALKYPLTVRDNDGNEFEVVEYYNQLPKNEVVVIINDSSYETLVIGVDCQWVEAEEQVKNCSTCKFDKDYTDMAMIECDSCMGQNPPSHYTPKQ